MSEQIKVSKEFMDNFNTIIENYGLSGEELDWLKKKARKSYPEVRESIGIMADNIKQGKLK